MWKFFTKKRGRAGFTLIELLVTITLIGIISVTTFAIIISSMNTFKKEQDIISAMGMKDMICTTLKDRLRKRTKMGVLTENLATPTDAAVAPPLFGTADQHDEYGDFVIDSRLKEYHMLYSEGGRIYTITSNVEGKYYVGAKYPASTLSAMPIDTKGKASSLDPSRVLDGEYGREPFMAERLYDDYFVDIQFKPIYTNTQGRYRDIQVIVKVFDDASMTPAHQVAVGTETFHMLNIENRQSSIKFQNDTAVTNKKEPQPSNFIFCYFA